MLAFPVVNAQTLTAPQRAVLAHSDTVQRHRNDIAAVERPIVLGQTGGNMRMVVQHALLRQRARLCPQRGTIARVRIGNDGLRGKIVYRLH